MVDVLVIGGGGAGLSSAIASKELGKSVILASKKSPTTSQTVMAQGGINAPLGEDDSIQLHIKDTLKASYKIADSIMVEKLISNSIATIKYLEEIGVPFSRVDGAKDQLSSIARRFLGGASRKRACYAQDYTGLKILQTLYDQAIKLGIEIEDDLFLLDLLVDNSFVAGGIFWSFNEGRVKIIQAKNVILATGGYGAIYQTHTTNSASATGDGIAAAIRAKARVANMEFMQFHPTALKNSSILISESARGEGGYLVNSDNKRFVDELAPRDIVVKAIFQELQKGKEVFLDLRHLEEEKINSLLPQEAKLCKIYANKDLKKDLIPISPALHYTIGGVDTKRDFSVVGLKGIYCIGEASCSYVHGANRLGGNSLLEIFTFGRLVAKELKPIKKEIKDIEVIRQKYEEKIEKIFSKNKKNSKNIFQLKKELAQIMFENFGILKEESKMQEGLKKIINLEKEFKNLGLLDKTKGFNQELIELFELENSILLSKVIAKSSLWRKESRGVFLRSDFTEESKEFECSSIYLFDEVKRREIGL